MEKCPNCGSTEMVILYRQGVEIIGCEHCIIPMDVWEVDDERT